jgi:membrane protein
LWKKQETGDYVREIDLLHEKHSVARGLDSETWSEIRDRFLEHNIITQNERGHYLLCRDLHTISFWQIKEWINEELPLKQEDIATEFSWQEDAYNMLRDQRSQQKSTLDITLAELFAR